MAPVLSILGISLGSPHNGENRLQRRNLPESSGEGGDQVFGKPVPNRLVPGEADAAGRAGVGFLDAVAADWNR